MAWVKFGMDLGLKIVSCRSITRLTFGNHVMSHCGLDHVVCKTNIMALLTAPWSKATPTRNTCLTRPYEGIMVANNPLIKSPIFLVGLLLLGAVGRATKTSPPSKSSNESFKCESWNPSCPSYSVSIKKSNLTCKVRVVYTIPCMDGMSFFFRIYTSPEI